MADTAQNAMAGGYNSISSGLVLPATLIFWSLALDYLSANIPFIERLLRSDPRCLIKDGKFQLQNMRHEMMTRNELTSHLREEGIENISEVRRAYIESDGKISIIKKNP